MKKIISIILVIAMLFACSISVSAIDDNFNEVNDKGHVTRSFLINQERAMKANNQINDWLYNETDSLSGEIKKSEYAVDGIHASQFPEFYAGKYINAKGNLVVKITASNIEEYEKSVLRRIVTDNKLTVAAADYSYSDLINTMSKIKEYSENNEKDHLIKFFAIDDYKNRIVIGLSEETFEQSEAIIDNIGINPDIIVVQVSSNESTEDSTTVNPGIDIHTSAGYIGSCGFRAKATYAGSTHEGFITAAHVTAPGETIKVNGTTIGTTSIRYSYGADLDAVFVATNSSANLTNSIRGTTYSYNGSYQNVVQGATCGMSGAYTQSTGHIAYSSYSYYYPSTNTEFVDLGCADYSSVNGDSGGIVYVLPASVYGQVYLYGVHRGTDASYRVFSKATNIVSEFSLTLY